MNRAVDLSSSTDSTSDSFFPKLSFTSTTASFAYWMERNHRALHFAFLVLLLGTNECSKTEGLINGKKSHV